MIIAGTEKRCGLQHLKRSGDEILLVMFFMRFYPLCRSLRNSSACPGNGRTTQAHTELAALEASARQEAVVCYSLLTSLPREQPTKASTTNDCPGEGRGKECPISNPDIITSGL